MTTGVLQLMVLWPQLRCFGCDKTTAPELLPAFYKAGFEVSLVTTENSGGIFLEAGIVGMTPQAVVAGANAAGWRKLTMSGKALYVCPECGKQRERPEWRSLFLLTEEDAL